MQKPEPPTLHAASFSAMQVRVLLASPDEGLSRGGDRLQC